MKVAFQGEKGAYSESAVYKFFGESVTVVPCRDLTETFESVTKKEAEYGVVPIENSIEGSVNQTYDLFLKYDLKRIANPLRFSDIVAERLATRTASPGILGVGGGSLFLGRNVSLLLHFAVTSP